MSLRENVLTLVDELWMEAEAAASRRSRVEARVRRDDANRILAMLGKPARAWSPPPEEPTSWQLAAAKE